MPIKGGFFSAPPTALGDRPSKLFVAIGDGGHPGAMGLLCDYFVAPDDMSAGETARWTGGPAQPPAKGFLRRRKVDGYRTVETDVEPAVMMSTLEHLMTGRPVDDLIDENAQRHVDAGSDDDAMVVRVSDGLVDALVEADEARLRAVAEPWSQTEEFFGQGDPEALARLLSDLAELARRARDTDAHLYCWVSP